MCVKTFVKLNKKQPSTQAQQCTNTDTTNKTTHENKQQHNKSTHNNNKNTQQHNTHTAQHKQQNTHNNKHNTQHNNNTETYNDNNITIVVFLTADAMMWKGLELCGFDGRRQNKVCRAKNIRRFKAQNTSQVPLCTPKSGKISRQRGLEMRALMVMHA